MRLTSPVDRKIHKTSLVSRHRLRQKQSTECPCEPVRVTIDTQDTPACHKWGASNRSDCHSVTPWLDELPIEICVRIARFTHLTDKNNNGATSLLNLAEVSDKQRMAVTESLSYEIRFPITHEERWARVFRNEVRRLVADCFLKESICHLLRSPTLHSATIPNLSVYLEAVSRSQTLKSLSIDFADRSPLEPLFHSVYLFFIALKALDLEELRIKCVGICVFKDILRSREAWADLAGFCPNLSMLEIVCMCSSKQVELSQVVSGMPSLRTFIFSRPVSHRTLSALRQVDSVTLRNVWDGRLSMCDQCNLAVKIGQAVTGIESIFFPVSVRPSFLTEDDVAALSICKRLTKLDVYLTAGAERSFPYLPELLSLRMRWEDVRSDDRRDQFHAPRRQFYGRVLNAAPNLRIFELFKIRISLRDLSQILSKLGSRLEVFGTSITGQKEPFHLRLLELLNLLSQHNHSLKNLEIFGYPHLFPNGDNAAFRTHWTEKILSAVKVLRRRSPFFDDSELTRFTHKWLTSRV